MKIMIQVFSSFPFAGWSKMMLGSTVTRKLQEVFNNKSEVFVSVQELSSVGNSNNKNSLVFIVTTSGREPHAAQQTITETLKKSAMDTFAELPSWPEGVHEDPNLNLQMFFTKAESSVTTSVEVTCSAESK